MKQNIILEKTFGFAVKVIKLVQCLQSKNKEFVLSKQVLRSATSIGANTEEAIAAQSSADFLSKLSIARKEARETSYWLRLIKASELYNCSDLITEANEIIRIITSIIMTTKQKEAKP